MTWQWTDTLVEPLASSLHGQRWTRVEKSKHDEGWLALREEVDGRFMGWVSVPTDGSELIPLHVMEDPRLPGVASRVQDWISSGAAVRLLSHKPGSRAIFHVEADEPHIVKLFRKNRHVESRWVHLPSGEEGIWRVPRIRSWNGSEKSLMVEVVPGTSFNEQWLRHGGGSEDGRRIAELLQWLQAHEIPAGVEPHTRDEEVRILQDRLPEVEEFLAAPPSGYRELTNTVCQSLANDPCHDLITSHRDLHDKQILIHGTRGALIDLDLLAPAPRALDPGNIMAHVRLRAMQGADIPWQSICAQIAEHSFANGCHRDSLHRWTAASLMRLALIYSRRRRAPEQLEWMLQSTRDALTRGGEWQGVL